MSRLTQSTSHSTTDITNRAIKMYACLEHGLLAVERRQRPSQIPGLPLITRFVTSRRRLAGNPLRGAARERPERPARRTFTALPSISCRARRRSSMLDLVTAGITDLRAIEADGAADHQGQGNGRPKCACSRPDALQSAVSDNAFIKPSFVRRLSERPSHGRFASHNPSKNFPETLGVVRRC